MFCFGEAERRGSSENEEWAVFAVSAARHRLAACRLLATAEPIFSEGNDGRFMPGSHKTVKLAPLRTVEVAEARLPRLPAAGRPVVLVDAREELGSCCLNCCKVTRLMCGSSCTASPLETEIYVARRVLLTILLLQQAGVYHNNLQLRNVKMLPDAGSFLLIGFHNSLPFEREMNASLLQQRNDASLEPELLLRVAAGSSSSSFLLRLRGESLWSPAFEGDLWSLGVLLFNVFADGHSPLTTSRVAMRRREFACSAAAAGGRGAAVCTAARADQARSPREVEAAGFEAVGAVAREQDFCL
ncbi:hypothetical protein Efla_002595 [Eimeria flavescens]